MDGDTRTVTSPAKMTLGPRPFRSQQVARPPIVRAIYLPVVLVIAGCNTATFRAADVPQAYRCDPATNHDLINLGRVSGPGYDSSLIGPHDLLEITVSSGLPEEQPTARMARVAEDGTVMVQEIGAVHVVGLEPLEASQNVSTAAVERRIYRQPHVTLEVAKKAVHRVTVLGEVAEPGVKELPRGSSDLLNAIAAAGGPTEEASTKVEIMRHSAASLVEETSADDGAVKLAAYQGAIPPPQLPAGVPADAIPPSPPQSPIFAPPEAIEVDLSATPQGGPNQFQLKDRDVVMVFPEEKRIIHVAGLVKKPGQFEIARNHDVHLLDAIAMAGGKSSPVADKVFVIRRVEGRPEPIVVQASISKCKHNGLENLRLSHGDMVSVEQTASTLMVDTALQFLRFTVGLAGRATVF